MVYGRGREPGFPRGFMIPFLEVKPDKKKTEEKKTTEEEGEGEGEQEEEETPPKDQTGEQEPVKERGLEDTRTLQHKDLPTGPMYPPTQALQKKDLPTQELHRTDMPTGPLNFRDYPTSILPRDPRDTTPTQILPKTPWQSPLFPPGEGTPPRTAGANQANARRRAEPIQAPQIPGRTQGPRTERPNSLVLFPPGQAGEAPAHQPQDPPELQPKPGGIPPGQEHLYDEKGNLQHLPPPPGGWGPGGAPAGHPDAPKPEGRVKAAAKTIGKETVKGAVQGALLGAAVPVAGETGVSEAGGAAAGAAKGLAVGVARAAGKGAVKGAAKGTAKSMGPLFPAGQDPDAPKKFR